MHKSRTAGWMLQAVVFAVLAAPAFYLGWIVALMPCLMDDTPDAYCSPHAGWRVFAGLALGLAAALVCGISCVKVVKRSLAEHDARRRG